VDGSNLVVSAAGMALENQFAHFIRVDIFKNDDAAVGAGVGHVTLAPLERLVVGASKYGS
jgi:hypothetical protein